MKEGHAACAACREPFKKVHVKHKWCSPKCAKQGSYRHSNTCTVCGSLFHSIKKTQKLCSRGCSARKLASAPKKYDPHCGLTSYQQLYRANNGAYNKLDYKKRFDLLMHLGGVCVHCGYNKDWRGLVLDHIRGDGKEDRERVGGRIYRYYIKHLDEAEKNLQVLCAGCNQVKAVVNKEHNRSRRVLPYESD